MRSWPRKATCIPLRLFGFVVCGGGDLPASDLEVRTTKTAKAQIPAAGVREPPPSRSRSAAPDGLWKAMPSAIGTRQVEVVENEFKRSYVGPVVVYQVNR